MSRLGRGEPFTAPLLQVVSGFCYVTWCLSSAASFVLQATPADESQGTVGSYRDMKATDWEFKNRALIFGMIFGLSFPLYFVDHQNSIDWLSGRLGAESQSHSDQIARALFFSAALICTAAALLRTWASSYLDANVVYAGKIKTAGLVAEGPYRYVRNPLYLANVMLALSMGAMMSRSGCVVAVLLMLIFCYRLIWREESELAADQRESYMNYRDAVPRLWPSLLPRVASAGQRAVWRAGIKAELWFWGFAIALMAFAITLNVPVFYSLLAASQLAFWLSSRSSRRPRL
jgi:protein-S-isoprenylcysteine O-methyltransferase Ste14